MFFFLFHPPLSEWTEKACFVISPPLPGRPTGSSLLHSQQTAIGRDSSHENASRDCNLATLCFTSAIYPLLLSVSYFGLKAIQIQPLHHLHQLLAAFSCLSASLLFLSIFALSFLSLFILSLLSAHIRLPPQMHSLSHSCTVEYVVFVFLYCMLLHMQMLLLVAALPGLISNSDWYWSLSGLSV